jgi:hypothetical protein
VGWEAAPPEGGAAPGEAGPDLDACLSGFPEDEVAASAESDRFTRASALAWSTTWVLRDPAAAETALARLSDPGFVECFVRAVAADVDPEHGAAELLGHVRDGTRTRLTAAGPEGTLTIHLDLLALREDRAVALLVLADTPDPLPDGDAVAARVRARLGGAATT